MECLKTFSVVICLVVLAGCVQMRDYTGIKEGAFGLDMQKGFGEGGNKKDYLILENGNSLIIGDSKNEVIAKIGIPDQVKTTIEGYESWVYESEKITLLFKGERLNDWHLI